MKIVLMTVISISLIACTENQKAKSFGGNAEMTLPKGEKLVNVTWKDDNLWYLTRPMTPTDSATTYSFHEESSFGVWEGTYTIIEQK
jgi:hypothetical protein